MTLLPFAFRAFSGLILLDMVALAMQSPMRKEPEFWPMLALSFGGFLAWSIWAGNRIAEHRSLGAAIALLGTLSAIILIGAALTTFAYPDPALHPWSLLNHTPRRQRRVCAVALDSGYS
jgi:threonine/homoserine efflux transporter RhtA